MRTTIAIAAIAALVLAACLSACGGTTTVKTVTVTSEATTPAEVPDAAPDASEASSTTADDDAGPPPTVTAPGRWARIDKISFKLDSFKAVDQINTNEFSDGPIVPAKGSALYEAVITWKNEGSSSADIFCGGSSAVLLDDRERNFDSDGDAAIQIDGNTMCGDDVQPGFKATATLVFHMPAKARPAAIALWNGDATYDPVGEDRYVLIGPLG